MATKAELKAQIEALRKRAYKIEPGKSPSVDAQAYADLQKAQVELDAVERQEFQDTLYNQIETARTERHKRQVVLNRMHECYGEEF